jgi:hypothetical protein
MLKKILDQLILEGQIVRYELYNVDENNNKYKEGKFRNTEQLDLTFPNGSKLSLRTACSGCRENTLFVLGDIK